MLLQTLCVLFMLLLLLWLCLLLMLPVLMWLLLLLVLLVLMMVLLLLLLLILVCASRVHQSSTFCLRLLPSFIRRSQAHGTSISNRSMLSAEQVPAPGLFILCCEARGILIVLLLLLLLWRCWRHKLVLLLYWLLLTIAHQPLFQQLPLLSLGEHDWT